MREEIKRADKLINEYIARLATDPDDLDWEPQANALRDPDLRVAETLLRAAVEEHEHFGWYSVLAETFVPLGIFLRLQGYIEEATECLTDAITILGDMPYLDRNLYRCLALAHCHRGLMRYREGKPQGALSDLTRCAEYVNARGLNFWPCTALGRLEQELSGSQNE